VLCWTSPLQASPAPGRSLGWVLAPGVSPGFGRIFRASVGPVLQPCLCPQPLWLLVTGFWVCLLALGGGDGEFLCWGHPRLPHSPLRGHWPCCPPARAVSCFQCLLDVCCCDLILVLQKHSSEGLHQGCWQGGDLIQGRWDVRPQCLCSRWTLGRVFHLGGLLQA